MELGIAIAVIIVMAFMLAYMKVKTKKASEDTDVQKPIDNIKYEITTKVLTEKEFAFYKSIKPIMDKHGYTIFAKMRLADIATVPAGTKNYMRYFNSIKSKHIDFVILNEKLTVTHVIEVDDKTHDRTDRIARDEFVDSIFKDSPIKMYHLRSWKVDELEQLFFNVETNQAQPAQQCDLKTV